MVDAVPRERANDDMEIGSRRRLARVVQSGPSFVFPVDDGLISGPIGSLADPRAVVQSVVQAGATSILGYPGVLRLCGDDLAGVGFIQNITGSTSMGSHTRKVRVASVDDALRSGADCVAVHVNWSDGHETSMLRTAGKVAARCRLLGMPLLVISYPRRAGATGDDNYASLRTSDPDRYTRLVAHCARVAAELGANLVKVPYTGSADSFRSVVDSALGCGVLVAGGAPTDDTTAIEVAMNAVRAGAIGVAFGRQTFLKAPDEAGLFVQQVLKAMSTVDEPSR